MNIHGTVALVLPLHVQVDWVILYFVLTLPTSSYSSGKYITLKGRFEARTPIEITERRRRRRR